MSAERKELSTVPHSSAARWKIWNRILLVLFFLCLLPVIPSSAKFHGDERFYTDAAIQMVKTGDYWTPYYPNGEIRLLKPVLTYWAAAGAFKVFGINLFAARLPFLLAAVLLLYVTWQLGRTIFIREEVAFFATLILASNIAITTLATRATPDVLVCLFVAASMWGFAKIWFEEDPTIWAPFLAYGGMGLAVQTKGLLGLCPLAANLLFCVFARPRRSQLKQLANAPAILLGIALGIFWYWIMLHRHGFGALQDFYSDQIGAKVSRSAGFVLGNFGAYLFAIVRHFLPWTLLLLFALVWKRREVSCFWKERRGEVVFLLTMAALLIVIFGFGNMRRTRYLTAAYPLLAVFLAGSLACFSWETFDRWLKPLLRLVAALVIVAGIILMAMGAGTHWLLAAGGIAFVITGLGGHFAVLAKTEVRRAWIAIICLVIFAVLGASIRPVFSPSPIDAAVAQLRQLQPEPKIIHSWKTLPSADGQVRLLSSGTIAVQSINPKQMQKLNLAPVVLTVSPSEADLQDLGFELHSVTNATSPLESSRWGRYLKARADKGHRNPLPTYWIGVRQTNVVTQTPSP